MSVTDEKVTISLTAEEIADLRRLLEVEKIRKVMQMYSQHMDSRNWDAMAGLYSEDAVCNWGPYGSHQGRDAIRTALIDGHPGRIPYDGFHITTNFWIETTGPDSAISRSYLTDLFPGPDTGPHPVIWYAVYENTYKKLDGEWKIAESVIEGIWPERTVSAGFPRAMTPSPIG
jgi:hypothetical protein